MRLNLDRVAKEGFQQIPTPSPADHSLIATDRSHSYLTDISNQCPRIELAKRKEPELTQKSEQEMG